MAGSSHPSFLCWKKASLPFSSPWPCLPALRTHIPVSGQIWIASHPLGRNTCLCPFADRWGSPGGSVSCPRPRGHSWRLCRTGSRDVSPQIPTVQVCKDAGEGRVPACVPMCATGPAGTACGGDTPVVEQHPLLLPRQLASLRCPSTCRSQRGSSVQLELSLFSSTCLFQAGFPCRKVFPLLSALSRRVKVRIQPPHKAARVPRCAGTSVKQHKH